MVVYVDIVFIENFIVNFFLLYVTGKTIKIKIKCFNLIIGSLIGCLYLIFSLYYSNTFIVYFPFKLIVSFIMIIFSFRLSDFLSNMKAEIILLLYSMLLAGLCLFFEFENNNILKINTYTINNFTYKKVMLSILIIFILFDRTVVYVKERKNISKYIYHIEVVDDGKPIMLNALFDTGNELREPVTNLPVVIVEKSSLCINLDKKEKYYIPFSTVSGNASNMVAFKPEKLYIYDNKDEKKLENAFIALTDKKLSKNNDYNALLSRGIFE